jgi:membrane protein YdbS with pleckstrin-like domain
MARTLDTKRRDLVMWSVGLVLAVLATVIAWAAGARLGSALTGGVIVLVIIVVAGLAIDRRG